MTDEEYNKYSDTISTSKEESLMKATAIFLGELEEQSKPQISRPDIDIVKMLSPVLSRLLILLVAFLTVKIIPITRQYAGLIMLVLIFIIIAVNFKSIIVSLILIYQRFAPARIRAACVFEPSCSNYMLMAIEKYGTVKGIYKGLCRLLRCHYPNSGIDYP